MSKFLILCVFITFEQCFSQLILPLRTPEPSSRRSTEAPNLPPSFPPKPSRARLENVEPLGEESNYANQPADPYNFAYNIKDEYGNTQYRKEESDGKGTIRGTYGYQDARGVFRFVEYIADAFGFRANIKSNEPGLTNSPSADVTLLAEETPRGIYESAASNLKPLQAESDELPPRSPERVLPAERVIPRVPKNVYAIRGNQPSASGILQYLVAAPVTPSTTTTDSTTVNSK
ncbi:cuticle protein 16.8-like protein [Dinothrombium tinctorium]|uniref:Cuticle protein 16.8-like protein n=1 Tax=Dinothrombium tinctorium TaxID=1965070 RepID=A0A443R513_9ACAR|nr:cuticle protein 16.8-like protein [Dinothrombium tinctorium]